MATRNPVKVKHIIFTKLTFTPCARAAAGNTAHREYPITETSPHQDENKNNDEKNEPDQRHAKSLHMEDIVQ